jgi:hypothetical protein
LSRTGWNEFFHCSKRSPYYWKSYILCKEVTKTVELPPFSHDVFALITIISFKFSNYFHKFFFQKVPKAIFGLKRASFALLDMFELFSSFFFVEFSKLEF